MACGGLETGRFSHDGESIWVTPEGCDVLLNPSHGVALIFETQVEEADVSELFGCAEAEVVETVVDGCEDDRLSHFDGTLDKVGTLVCDT